MRQGRRPRTEKASNARGSTVTRASGEEKSKRQPRLWTNSNQMVRMKKSLSFVRTYRLLGGQIMGVTVELG